MENEMKIHESYFCQWTEGAKEYFDSFEEALKKANEMYVKTERMNDENFAYWCTQKSIVGKEIKIIQQLGEISFNNTIKK